MSTPRFKVDRRLLGPLVAVLLQAPAAAGQTGLTVPAAAFGSIEGSALDVADRGLPGMRVRLRNASSGRMVATQITDRAGAFAFLKLDPGKYVAELMHAEGRIAVASELLVVNSGQRVTTILRLPAAKAGLAGWLSTPGARAAAITAAAAAAGVLSRAPTPPVSPE